MSFNRTEALERSSALRERIAGRLATNHKAGPVLRSQFYERYGKGASAINHHNDPDVLVILTPRTNYPTSLPPDIGFDCYAAPLDAPFETHYISGTAIVAPTTLLLPIGQLDELRYALDKHPLEYLVGPKDDYISLETLRFLIPALGEWTDVKWWLEPLVTELEYFLAHYTRYTGSQLPFRLNWPRVPLYFEPVDSEHRTTMNPEVSIKLPERGTGDAAGYDLFAPYPIRLKPGESLMVWTDVKCDIPEGKFLDLRPRSSSGGKPTQAVNPQIILRNTVGTVDSNYYSNPSNDGNMGLFLKNVGEAIWEAPCGAAIVQGVVKDYYVSTDDTTTDERVGGFGSTDKKE